MIECCWNSNKNGFNCIEIEENRWIFIEKLWKLFELCVKSSEISGILLEFVEVDGMLLGIVEINGILLVVYGTPVMCCW